VTPAPPIVGQHFAHWRVLGTDETGKRILCCCACGRVQQLGLDELLSGATSSCGCKPPTRPEREAQRLRAAKEQSK
jgi:hypothetical protein